METFDQDEVCLYRPPIGGECIVQVQDKPLSAVVRSERGGGTFRFVKQLVNDQPAGPSFLVDAQYLKKMT